MKVDENLESMEFEENLQELENIASELEQGDLKLQKCVELYSRGRALIASCEKQVKEAKLMIETIENQN